MSHQPERNDKDCLNCGSMVLGRYCHVCGQENIVTHQNFSGLTKHFVYDIFHFDGKFFDTLKYLLVKPGFVAKEYISGKRAKYLDPIRMYLFVSAVFFLFFFSIAKSTVQVKETDTQLYIPKQGRIDLANSFKEQLRTNPNDSMAIQKINLLLDTTKQVKFSDLEAIDPPSMNIGGRKYKSVIEYDSLQNLLPKAKRDNWFLRKLFIKQLEISARYKGDWRKVSNDFIENFLHRMPYLMFFSLPFFALILKLLYIRRKNFFYSDHAVFTLYHYIFSFFILLLIFGFIALKDWLHWDTLFNWLIFGVCIYWLIYLYKSMRKFYGQRRAKTIGKFILLNLFGFTIIFFLFLVFIFFSVFQL